METIGVWIGNGAAPAFKQADLLAAVPQLRSPAHVVQDPASGALGVAQGGLFMPQGMQAPGGTPAWPVLATLPPIYPEWLGDRSFCETHAVRFPYVSGAMANGIASTRLVIAMARAGFLGFFGAAGLGPATIEQALHELERELGTADSGGLTWGANLIHSPNEPAIEERVADLYIRRGVRRVSAAAYMRPTPPTFATPTRGWASVRADGSGASTMCSRRSRVPRSRVTSSSLRPPRCSTCWSRRAS